MIEDAREANARVLPSIGSYHWPVSLIWDDGRPTIRHPFWFEQFWIEHKGFKELISKWWEEMEPPRGTLMYQFQQKMKQLKAKIRTWNKEEFGVIFQDKKLLKIKLEEL